jgi:hypothetical protein
MTSPHPPSDGSYPSDSEDDWEELSPEAKLQSMGADRWGWVIYRCSFAREFDAAWEDLKHRMQQGLRASIARSDAPGVAETTDFVFVEDPALEDAPIDELRRRFQQWVREDTGRDIEAGDGVQPALGPRHNFFVRWDGEGMWGGYVGLIQAWPLSLQEDWMKVRISAIAPELYVELENMEVWYANYRPPENGVCIGWY